MNVGPMHGVQAEDGALMGFFHCLNGFGLIAGEVGQDGIFMQFGSESAYHIHRNIDGHGYDSQVEPGGYIRQLMPVVLVNFVEMVACLLNDVGIKASHASFGTDYKDMFGLIRSPGELVGRLAGP